MREPSDWLNPILVKELRQGVRGNIFTGAFLLLQFLMLISMAIALIESSVGGDRDMSTGFFWFLIAVPVLLILPISGGLALSGERTVNTLEPMLLTRLSARRIVLGKWGAIAGQSALLVSAVLPYVVLRYFLGGVNLAYELLGLLDLMVSSALLAGITVGLSAAPLSGLFRWLLAVGVAAIVLIQLHVVLVPAFARPGGAEWVSVVVGSSLTLLVLLMMLEAGALQIAPPAETSTSRIRLLAVLALVLGAWACHGKLDEVRGTLVFWTTVVQAGVAVASLCEGLKEIPSLYAPYLRVRGVRALLGLLLCPGWPSGVLFTIALTLGYAVGYGPIVKEVAPGGLGPLFFVGATLGALLMPLVVLRVLVPRSRRTFAFYLLLQLAALVVPVVYAIGEAVGSASATAAAEVVAGGFPLAYLLMLASRAGVRAAGIRPADVVFAVTTAVYVLLVLWKAVRTLRELKRFVRQEAEAASADGRHQAAAGAAHVA